MRILTPEDAKKGSSAAKDELMATVRDLSAEEERLVKSVNDLRVNEAAEKERTEIDMAKFRAEAKEERDRISAEVTAKESEVIALEERRAEAMKPIEEVRAEADARNEKSKEREAELEKAEADFKVVTADFVESSNDRKQELDEREETLDGREKGIKAEEATLKESGNRLVGEWAKYHAAVAVANEREADLVQREDRAATSEKANEIRAGALDDRERGLEGRERLLRSNYQALEEAKKHLGIQ